VADLEMVDKDVCVLDKMVDPVVVVVALHQAVLLLLQEPAQLVKDSTAVLLKKVQATGVVAVVVVLDKLAEIPVASAAD
jgi:hypothetical protein